MTMHSANSTTDGGELIIVPLGEVRVLDVKPKSNGRRVTKRFAYLGDVPDPLIKRMCAVWTRELWMHSSLAKHYYVNAAFRMQIAEEMRDITRQQMFALLNARHVGEWALVMDPSLDDDDE